MERLRSPAGRLPGRLFCALAFFLFEGSVVYQANAVDVEVKDAANETCLFGKWNMDLTITYETEHDEYKSTVLTFPDHVRYDGSSCENDLSGPVLAIEFGEGHSWNISFTKTNDTYQGTIFFTYNTNDTTLFPDAKMKGLITTSANYPLQPVDLNTVFICQNTDFVESGSVIQNFRNVTLEAFLPFGSLSPQKTVCDKDAVVTPEPAAPNTTTTTTTTTTTMMSNTTSIMMPNTTSIIEENQPAVEANTTILSSRSISQPDEIPATGTYSVKNGTEICLLATMGLQLNMTMTLMNINPNTTTASGQCDHRSSVLTLKDVNIMVEFTFAIMNTSFERFYLKVVDVTVTNPVNGTQYAANDNLTFWEASLGSSYMCRKKEHLVVSPSCSLNVFNLRIQPFQVQNGEFSIAEDCIPEVDNFFVPIMMGACLAGLIALVFMAYFVGRKTHHNAAYQQL